jgi:Spy/CpxP family protein refolding chaperone
MFGFFIGTACLVGLVMTVRRGRHGHCGAYGFGPRSFGRRGWGGARGGSRFFLSILFDRLETTPAQEKVIVVALDELRDAARAQRSEVRRTRDDVAAAVRSPSFDETRLGELFARHDTAIESMRRAAVGAIGKIHAVLEDNQRERLADLIEAGPIAFRARGYGDGGWRGCRGEPDGDGHWA